LFNSNTATASNTGAFNVSNLTQSLETTIKWQGTNCLKLVHAGGGGVGFVDTASAVTATNTVKYLVSFYVYAASTNQIQFYVHDGGTTYETATVTPVVNRWIRCVLPITGTAVTNRYLRILTTNDTAQTFYIDGLQFEALNTAQPTPTQWIDGTRASSTGPYYNVGNASSASITLSAWVRSSARISGANEVLIDVQQTTSTNRALLYVTDAGMPAFLMTNALGQGVTSTSAAAITAGAAWHHVVGVYDAVNAMQYLYVNGALVDSDANTYAAPSFSADAVVSIGTAYNANTWHCLSGVDEAIVLPYAAPSGLVTALYIGYSVPWVTLPRIKISGDAVDGIATVQGNTANGLFMRLSRDGAIQKNNIALSFDLEEV
jgi:hypothetical protein